jgi:AcrR family transcriptional regulator
MQLKKQELVRQEIWSAAMDLFEQDGFDTVTIEQIAKAAGVSRRTFFRYFASKEDVMASLVRLYSRSICDAIAEEPAASTGLELARSVLKKVLKPSPVAVRVMEVADRSPAARMAQFLEAPVLEENVTRALALRRRRSETLHDRVLASLMMTATRLSMEMWRARQRRSMAEIIDQVLGAMTTVCRVEEST